MKISEVMTALRAGYVRSALAGEYRDQTLGMVVTASNGIEDVTLSRSSALRIDQAGYVLDETIAVWETVDATTPWHVRLLLQSDARSTTVFRMCWHFQIPRLIRLQCGKYDRLTGEFRGIFVVDDSSGLGPRTWETQ